ncbi:uncharacterized protein DUF4936 [Pseudoduganella flava]|uniref:DUF4936 family protein n=1 Tax=Pseudoduganella flava TaxID=871742 RepID=A0A562PQ47_9BURK|nr:DUF4936 family protein [Pseudoduganella flava]QGZ37728.1 DUF4936 family protein [Pseudoduganella flava]TWI46529.1 uncharacterized protein DUF4936 [Pseudoduganella flava]
MDLYVYYRVRDEDAERLLPRVRALQAALAAAHGVAPQLKRRPGSTDGMQTWMEVYPATAAGFTDALAQAVSTPDLAADLGALIAGPRHTEVFTDIPSCA